MLHFFIFRLKLNGNVKVESRLFVVRNVKFDIRTKDIRYLQKCESKQLTYLNFTCPLFFKVLLFFFTSGKCFSS